ncbi:disintegrin and metalloproteinase domain-containing protein 20-like [Python bivittatus]|uniref:Disintegrin and metalloproteinase domain-containing protein 20-like n=1 Tax=Python bivittatus TaxID=176946 RepID=A0A9F2PNA6_PYTBI|nr:disintegrin and metalloproteinase domain-containing protein 20-like [Python bivittatus]
MKCEKVYFKGFLLLWKMIIHLLWLLMLLRNVLTVTASQILPQGFIYASYEVTIPWLLSPKPGQQEPQNVTYLLQCEGKNIIMHLTQKRDLVPKHLPIFTYSEDGDLQLDYPFFRDDCYYHGFVQDKLFSLVTLSICSGGLKGILQLENKTYEIEPIQGSTTFQHVIYRLEEKESAIQMRCGLTQEEQKHQEAMFQNIENVVSNTASKGDWWLRTRYVEIAVVIEHERYLKFAKNETLTALQVLDIIHIANSFYEPLSVQLCVVGLEIWSQKNFIMISPVIDRTLQDFSDWRRDSLVNRLKSDVGHLFACKTFELSLGSAYVGTVCDERMGSAVISYMTSSLSIISSIFAHELGHNLGMLHDEQYCSCGRVNCIMAPVHEVTDKFSNCSYNDYFLTMNAPCLLSPPDPDRIFKIKLCGNRVVDKEEQCDCGSEAQCKLDPCCQSNCTFRSGVSCAFGQCCAKCQYLKSGTVCREKTSYCDLPEYCNGTSEWCPEDVYVQNGAPCSDDAYCYRGNCMSEHTQCKMIFGFSAKTATDICFREMNAKGDRFGNCGLKHGIYHKCQTKNILCGRIQCENVQVLPSLEEHNTIIQIPLGNKQCWSIDYHSGMKIADIGAVTDGSPCGKDRMCIDRKCVSVSLLKYDCNITKCHNRGVCNNYKHCHCDYGWAPPDCLKKGHGGSIDSGPPRPHKHLSTMAKAGIIGGIIYIFSSAFVLVSLAIYFRYGFIRLFRRFRGRPMPTTTELNIQ